MKCIIHKKVGTKSMHNRIIGKAFKELFKASRSMFMLSYTLTFLQGLSRVLPIIALQQLFDHLYIYGKGGTIFEVTKYIALFFGARCICYLINLFTNYMYEKYNMTAAYGMTDRLNREISKVGAKRFEDSAFLDDATKAYRGTKSIRKFIDTWMLIILLYMPEIFTIVLYLHSASALLPLILLAVLIPELIVIKLKEKEFSEQEEKAAIITRKKNVLEDNAFKLRSNIESRVLGYVDLLEKKIKEHIHNLSLLDYGYYKKKNRLNLIEKLVLLAGRMIIFAILLGCTVKSIITIGVFATLITNLDELFGLTSEVLQTIADGVAEELEKIRNFFKLINSTNEEGIANVEIDSIDMIEFKDVSFSYPGRSENAIKGISTTIQKGERIAIVGENGSGKSTFLKLLSGLYESDEGKILINGIDVRRITKESMYEAWSTVFQNYGKYALKLDENICLSHEKRLDILGKIKKMEGLEAIEKIDSTKVLSREFGGIDLSGGLWQRVAIARSVYKCSGYIMLDEPTSAIDPNEEKNLYNLFECLMNDKTSLIVTHRMGTTKLARRILVFDDGRIVGDGNHDELMNNCETYRKLWLSQATIYQ